MGNNNAPTSPWYYYDVDPLGRQIRITIPFNETTLALLNGTVYRDAGCLYTKVYIGLGGQQKVFQVPEGTTELRANALSQSGLDTYSDLVALQVTAGP